MQVGKVNCPVYAEFLSLSKNQKELRQKIDNDKHHFGHVHLLHAQAKPTYPLQL